VGSYVGSAVGSEDFDVCESKISSSTGANVGFKVFLHANVGRPVDESGPRASKIFFSSNGASVGSMVLTHSNVGR